MTLKEFLRAGYAVYVDVWRSMPGESLLSAIEKANQSLGLAPVEPAVAMPTPADNDAALRELERATAGLKRRR